MPDLELVDVVQLHEMAAGPIAWSSAPAREAAGLDAYASIHYQSLADATGDEQADSPILIGVGDRIPVDGRGDPRARPITPGERRVKFAAQVLEDTLGIDAAEIEREDPRVAIFAAEGVVAFQRAVDVASISLDEATVEAIQP